MQMPPNGAGCCDDLDVAEVVVDDEPEVAIDSKESHAVEVGHNVEARDVLSRLREGVVKHVVHRLFTEKVDGHEQHVGIEHQADTGWGLQQQVACLESFAQIGCNTHSALHHIGLVDNALLAFIAAVCRECHGSPSDAQGQPLLGVTFGLHVLSCCGCFAPRWRCFRHILPRGPMPEAGAAC